MCLVSRAVKLKEGVKSYYLYYPMELRVLPLIRDQTKILFQDSSLIRNAMQKRLKPKNSLDHTYNNVLFVYFLREQKYKFTAALQGISFTPCDEWVLDSRIFFFFFFIQKYLE